MITNNKIISFINYLNKVNSSTNIFYEPFKEDFPLGDYVVEFIIDNEKELNNFFNTKNNLKLEEFARKIIEYSTSKTVETIIGLNQYVQIDNLLTNRLSQLYEEFIYKIIRMLNLYETINLDYVNRIEVYPICWTHRKFSIIKTKGCVHICQTGRDLLPNIKRRLSV